LTRMASNDPGFDTAEQAQYSLLESFVASCIKGRFLVIALTILLAGIGVWSFLNMHIDAVPDISNVQVTVTTNCRGLAPTEVEQYVTFPVELALQSMPKLLRLRSVSKYALSQVTAVFEDGTDIYWARQQISERIKLAQEQMPPGGDIKIFLGPIATGLGEIYQFEVRGTGYSQMQLRTILDWEITPLLKTVPGVDEVESMGGEAKEYQVWIHPEKLHGFKLSLEDVTTALATNNGNAGGGYSEDGDNLIYLRAQGLLTAPEDIGDVLIRRTASGVVRVKDVADVKIYRKLPVSIVTQNGKGQITIGIVLMRKGENSRQMVERIKTKVAEIQKNLPLNVTIVPFYDRGILIDRTIDTVWHNLIEGAVLVVIVLFVLLGNITGGIIAALAIPLSLLGAVTFLTLSNTSGNLLSLGAIDFGILIDGSVVMIDHILRKLSEAKPRNDQERLLVVTRASQEVASPILFAVLIITVVYMPVLFLPGVSGKTFEPMALTVVFGLLTALAIALFLTPALAYLFMPKVVDDKDALFMRLIRPVYNLALKLSSRFSLITAAFALLIFAVSLTLIPHLGSEFITQLKEGSFVLTVDRPVSASFNAAARQTTIIEKLLLEFPEVTKVVSRTGHSEEAFDPMGPDESDIFVTLKPQSEWAGGQSQEDLERAIDKRLREEVAGAGISISQPIEQRMNELVAGAKCDVAVRVSGPDLDKLRQLGGDIAQTLGHIDGCEGIRMEKTSGFPVMTAELNKNALAAYGVSVKVALDAVTAAVDGKVVGTIFQGRPRYPLVVRFAPEDIASAEDMGGLPCAMSGGDLVPLSQVAHIVKKDAPAQIAHQNGNRVFTVQTNVRGRDLGSFIEQAQKEVAANVTLPAGYHIEWGGQFENLKAAQDKLLVLVPVALVLIGILLYCAFGSARPVLLVFLNIPLAMSGGLFGLAARGMQLSVTAGVGFIALFGVAVLNGVVLVSTIRQLELQQGLDAREAALQGAKERLRPVLMTALVASLGFLPMALATSVGAEVQRPLATVVIGGLITSTLLTLLVLPTQYAHICGNLKGRARKAKLVAEIEPSEPIDGNPAT
jgi:cobalt-zinc-cadmium resistance protein CzcA